MEANLPFSIQVSPQQLWAGARTVLQIEFVNRRAEPLHHLRGRFRVGEGMLMLGSTAFWVPVIPPNGQSSVHRFVKPLQGGEVRLQVDRLTVRIGGDVQRIPDQTFALQVYLDAQGVPGSLQMVCQPSILSQGVWSLLRLWVFNSGEVPVVLRGPCLEGEGIEFEPDCLDSQEVRLLPDSLWKTRWRCRPLGAGDVVFRASFPVKTMGGQWKTIASRFTLQVEPTSDSGARAAVGAQQAPHISISIGDVVQVHPQQGLLSELTQLALEGRGHLQMGNVILLEGRS